MGIDGADLYSDEIAIIDRGKMVRFGTADELKHSIRREVIQFSLMNHIVAEDAENALPVVMEILRNGGISIKKISMTRPTLDDVFLKYAGAISLQGGGISEITQIRSRKG
jgi:ABC-2 type transport system ATP-binding protein